MVGPGFVIVPTFITNPDLPQIILLLVRHVFNTVVIVLDEESEKSKPQEYRESRAQDDNEDDPFLSNFTHLERGRMPVVRSRSLCENVFREEVKAVYAATTVKTNERTNYQRVCGLGEVEATKLPCRG